MNANKHVVFFQRAFLPLLLGSMLFQVRGQSPFHNLDFEEAKIVPIPGDHDGMVYFSSAFPGWSGLVGTNQAPRTLFNNQAFGSGAIALLGPGWPYPQDIIQGSFTPFLQAGSDVFFNLQDVSLFQTGLVPEGTESLRFIANEPRNGFRVSLNGQPLDLAIIDRVTTRFDLYADVSMFAGKTETLEITVLSATSRPANLAIDAIEFSPAFVPEPSSFPLMLLGGAIAFHRKYIRYWSGHF